MITVCGKVHSFLILRRKCLFIDIPLHPTLFISVALLSGFALAPLLAYVDDKSPIKNTTSNANRILTTMWFLAFAFTIALFVIYNSNPAKDSEEISKALAPFGMMIAAMIASASVMKNIAETKAHDLAKSEKEKEKERKRIFVRNVMNTIHTTVEVFINKHSEDPTDMTTRELIENSQVVQKMLDLIFINDVLPYLDVKQQQMLSDIYTQFCDFTVKYINRSPRADDVTWPVYALDRYNHFKIFSENYIESSE